MVPSGYDPAARFRDMPECVPVYREEIIDYFLERELTMPRDPEYLTVQQSEVTERMRRILFDWLVDVCIKFKLHPETFYLTCNIVDRYLMLAKVSRATLQLVGITAVLIASKHEEIWPPEVKECVYITANSYAREEILRMERDMADSLQFRFAVPTMYPILTHMLESVRANRALEHLAHYYLESSVLCYALLQFVPSRVAYGALYLAEMTLLKQEYDAQQQPLSSNDLESIIKPRVWTPYHVASSRQVAFDDVRAAAGVLLHYLKTTLNDRYCAVMRKYSTPQFMEVSRIYALPDFV